MRQKLWLLILVCGIGCQKSDPIERLSILGNYHYVEEAKDYSHLELRADNTYYFDQGRMHSCDFWGHWYGDWEIIENKLVLYEGINLDTLINITSKTNLESDTLLITFGGKLMQEFPKLKARIGLDTIDTEIVNNKIIFDKRAYCIRNKILKDVYRKDKDIYKYYPLKLNIRSQEFYQIEDYILDKEEIVFSLGSFKQEKIEKKKLIEYRKYDEVLKSKTYVNWINNHKLKKRIGKLQQAKY